MQRFQVRHQEKRVLLAFERLKGLLQPLQQAVIRRQDVCQSLVRTRPIQRSGLVLHYAERPERVVFEQGPDLFGNGERVHVPAFLVELGHPGGRLPLDLEDLLWRKDEVVNRLEARMTELTPLRDRKSVV